MLNSSSAAAQSGELASEETRLQNELISKQKNQKAADIVTQGEAANLAQTQNTKAQLGPVNAGFSSMLLTGTKGLPTKPGTSLGGKTLLGM